MLISGANDLPMGFQGEGDKHSLSAEVDDTSMLCYCVCQPHPFHGVCLRHTKHPSVFMSVLRALVTANPVDNTLASRVKPLGLSTLG